jgi:acetoin utilization protein AcuB
MLVRDRMTTNVVTVSSYDTLATAASRMKAAGLRRLPVVDERELVGIISAYDLRNWPDGLTLIAVRAAMTRNPVTVSSTDSLEHAVSVAHKRQVGGLPVVDHGRLVGMIVARDLFIAEPRAIPEWAPSRKGAGLRARIR